MYKLSALLIAVLLFVSATAQQVTKKVSYAGDKLSMLLPATMDTMSAENVQAKYHKTPDGKTKYFATTDFTFSIVLSVVVPSGVTEADLVKHKDELIGQLLAKYELAENEVITVNGHKIIVVSFSSDVPGGKIFNRRFFAAAGGRLVMVAYNTTEEDLANRKAQIEASIRSVTIK